MANEKRERRQAIIRAFREHRSVFNMSVFEQKIAGKDECGTHRCVAGMAAYLFPELNWADRAEQWDTPHLIAIAEHLGLQTFAVGSYPVRAFFTPAWPDEFYNEWAHADTLDAELDVLQKVLEHFAIEDHDEA